MTYISKTRDRTRTDFIAVHCSATGEKTDIGAADIDRWHRKQGWDCIGYHYVIRRNGTLEVGRDEKKIGSHVSAYNAVAVGVCLVGGVDANDVKKAVNNYTPAQFATLKKLLIELKTRYPKAIIQGHRDFPKVAKACPCFNVKDWVKAEKI